MAVSQKPGSRKMKKAARISWPPASAKLGAKLFDGVLLLALAGGQEIRAAFFIFLDPGFCETAIADLGKNFAHLFASLLGDDARSGGIVALFGGIADGVTHVAEAAAVDQVNDEFQFMHTFEIGDLGLVAGFCKSVESGLDQFTHTATKHACSPKRSVSVSSVKSCFQNACARAAESLGIGKGERFRGTRWRPAQRPVALVCRRLR